MKKLMLALVMGMTFAVAAIAQSSDQGTILKWDVEAYGKQKQETRNAAVYYVQIGDQVYRATQGNTKPGPLASTVGKVLQCRVKKDSLYITDEKGKQLKYSIIGVSKAP
jgi:hypothetical protein